MLSIFFKELRFFFNSVVAYVVIAFFLLAMGLFIWVLPEYNILDKGYASLQMFFDFCPYLFIFFVPAITMHTFAEERRSGTMELLLSVKTSKLSIVLGKYLACMCVIVLLLLLSTIYYWILWSLSTPIGNLDSAAIVGSYFGLVLLAASFTIIGLFSSIITNKQIVAFIIASFFCGIFYQGFESLKILLDWSKYSLELSQFGIKYHYNSISRGVIDSRDLIYFILFISFFTWLSCKKIAGSSF